MLGVSYVMTFYVDVLRRCMRTCVSSTVGRSICQSRHYVSALWCQDKNFLWGGLTIVLGWEIPGFHDLCINNVIINFLIDKVEG